jgi:hypothetical protein
VSWQSPFVGQRRGSRYQPAACPRDDSASLSRIFATWRFTVCGLRSSPRAMSLFALARGSRASTSSSRPVSSLPAPPASAARDPPNAAASPAAQDRARRPSAPRPGGAARAGPRTVPVPTRHSPRRQPTSCQSPRPRAAGRACAPTAPRRCGVRAPAARRATPRSRSLDLGPGKGHGASRGTADSAGWRARGRTGRTVMRGSAEPAVLRRGTPPDQGFFPPIAFSIFEMPFTSFSTTSPIASSRLVWVIFAGFTVARPVACFVCLSAAKSLEPPPS